MQNANHWFVVYDGGPEFRMTRWSPRTRLRPKARHLCGQTCLHKLVDDFMARTISDRAATMADKAGHPQPEKAQPEPSQREKEKKAPPPAIKAVEASLTAGPPQTAPIRAAVPIPHTYPDTYIDDYESSARLITPVEPERKPDTDAPVTAPNHSSRSWRADAWKREREREQREATHRRSIA
jgi:hypothetical protein